MNAGVPGREVGREEEGGEGNDDAERAAGPVHGLSADPRDHEQEGQRQRQPPEPRRHWPDFR